MSHDVSYTGTESADSLTVYASNLGPAHTPKRSQLLVPTDQNRHIKFEKLTLVWNIHSTATQTHDPEHNPRLQT